MIVVVGLLAVVNYKTLAQMSTTVTYMDLAQSFHNGAKEMEMPELVKQFLTEFGTNSTGSGNGSQSRKPFLYQVVGRIYRILGNFLITLLRRDGKHEVSSRANSPVHAHVSASSHRGARTDNFQANATPALQVVAPRFGCSAAGRLLALAKLHSCPAAQLQG